MVRVALVLSAGFAPVTATAVAVAVAAAPRPAVAQETSRPLGPLRGVERNPLYRLFLTPVVDDADLVAAGHFAVTFSTAYSNIFERGDSPTHSIVFDLERLATAVTVRFGLGADFEAGLRFGTQSNWGGFLDPFIQRLHGFFGLPNADREQTANGSYGVFISDLQTFDLLMKVPSGTSVDDPVAHLKWRVAGRSGSPSALALELSGKLPLGSEAVSSGRADLGVELSGRRSWAHTHLHASVGAVLLAASSELHRFMRGVAGIASLALERRVTGSVAVVAQVQGGTPYARRFDAADLDGIPMNLVLGLAGEVPGGWTWQASFAEDVPPFGPSVDFTLDIQLSRHW